MDTKSFPAAADASAAEGTVAGSIGRDWGSRPRPRAYTAAVSRQSRGTPPWFGHERSIASARTPAPRARQEHDEDRGEGARRSLGPCAARRRKRMPADFGGADDTCACPILADHVRSHPHAAAGYSLLMLFVTVAFSVPSSCCGSSTSSLIWRPVGRALPLSRTPHPAAADRRGCVADRGVCRRAFRLQQAQRTESEIWVMRAADERDRARPRRDHHRLCPDGRALTSSF